MNLPLNSSTNGGPSLVAYSFGIMKREDSILSTFLRGWKKVGKKIGDFQARLLLILFYFIIIAPFAPVVRHSDPMAFKAGSSRGWRLKDNMRAPTLEQARKQF